MSQSQIQVAPAPVARRVKSFTRDTDPFTLDAGFIERYVGRQPAWGEIGFVTFRRTYARSLDSVPTRIRDLGRKYGLREHEEFWLTAVRVVEGCFLLQQQHCTSQRLPWSNAKAQKSAQDMFERLWAFKWLPPGRGLWMMGTERVLDGRAGAAAFNCGAVTTANIDDDLATPFCWLMDMSMLGVGVGFDCSGAGTVTIQQPSISEEDSYVIADSREGWVGALRVVLNAFSGKGDLPRSWDVSGVRPYGSAIIGFGGTASGPEPLLQMLRAITQILCGLVGQLITTQAIVDIANIIGRCVVAGNVRRSALLAAAPLKGSDFINFKDYSKYPERADWGWASNNSILAEVGMDYTEVAKATGHNGEPGFLWLENMRNFGRMKDAPDNRDHRVISTNPCQPGWATVLTPEGIRTFDDVTVGSIIWSGQRWTKIVRKLATGTKPVFGYKTRAGSFFGTEDHKVIVDGERVRAADAEVLTSVQGPWKPGQALPEVTAEDVLDGLVIGDGMVHKASNDLVVLCVGTNDKAYFDDKQIGRLFREPRPGLRDRGRQDVAWEVRTSIAAAELPRTYDRRVPKRFWQGDREVMRGFLRGLYSANGSVVANRITLKAASRALIEQVQEMLSALGVRAYVTVNKPHDVEFANGTYTCRESYDLNIGTYLGRMFFVDNIGFVQPDKQARAKATLEGVSEKAVYKTAFDVVERVELGEEPVYDITVDADEHTYWTGGVLVSNCGEITLEDRELCNICSVYPAAHDTYEDFQRTIKMAYLYNKTVTLIATHDSATNAVMLKNRRIGVSAAGIAQAEARHGRRTLMGWLDRGYGYVRNLDAIYSDWLCIPRSIKTTTVKPDGTSALLMGATPGIHYAHNEFYMRVIRFDSGSPLVDIYHQAGYRCEVVKKEPNTTAVYFPVREKLFARGKADVSMWEQLELVAQLQENWVDNAVSATVHFKKDEAKDIAHALSLYESRLKTISFLPYVSPEDERAEFERMGFEHPPYQAIDRAEWSRYSAGLKPVRLGDNVGHEVTEKFCDGDKCIMPAAAIK